MSCSGCGMFRGHINGCRGFVAVYMHYYSEYQEDGFQTLEEAEDFLRTGEDYGNLASRAVLDPSGKVVKSRAELGYAWP